MKKYERISEEDLVEKILRAQLLKDMRFRLHRSEVQEGFNKFWGIDIKKLIDGFNKIQGMIEYLDYMNEVLICDSCGKHFTRWERNASNKSGRHFCSDSCAMRFSASFSNTEEKRLKRSRTLKQGLIDGRIRLPHLTYEEALAIKEKYDANPKLCPICGNPIPYKKRFHKTCSTGCGRTLNGISNHNTQMVRHSSGGIRRGSSHGKKGWYKGFWCDSSWELSVVIYFLEHKISFKRNHSFFPYYFNGRWRKYYPDFILDDGSFLEVKGYSSKQWNAKVNQFPEREETASNWEIRD